MQHNPKNIYKEAHITQPPKKATQPQKYATQPQKSATKPHKYVKRSPFNTT
jgi:hypothetical protein